MAFFTIEKRLYRGGHYSGIQPISRPPQRPTGWIFWGSSREGPPQARLSFMPPPLLSGKEESSLLGTASKSLEYAAIWGGHCPYSQGLQATSGLHLGFHRSTPSKDPIPQNPLCSLYTRGINSGAPRCDSDISKDKCIGYSSLQYLPKQQKQYQTRHSKSLSEFRWEVEATFRRCLKLSFFTA